MNQKKSNYQIQSEKLQLEFIKWDHEAIAKKFNLNLDKQYLYIDFVGQKYRINRQAGITENSKDGRSYETKAGFNEIMSFLDLFYYSKDEPKLSGRWDTIQSVSRLAHSGTFVASSHFDRYAKSFSGKCKEFEKACLILHGKPANYADISYIIKTFDFLPVMIQFWDCDDEFPAQLKLLWDENILDYVHFETTYYIADHLLNRIKEIIEMTE
jgi:hypothetical protein